MQNYHVRAKQGIKLLMGRQVCLQVLTFGGGVVLARVLSPAQFGLYAIATFLVGVFSLMGDFGLAPSFIQRNEELTDKDLRVAFTLQQALTTIVVVLLLLTAPWLVALYPKAPPHTVWLVRTLALSLYLTSWRSMSALQLERQLRYDKLAKIEVVETLSFQGIAVVMALAGYGVWSFVWAALARGILGTVMVYVAAPWQIRFAFDRTIAKSILRFGIPFQFQGFTNSFGGWMTPLLVGGLFGPQAVGFLGWASSNGKKPLILVDNVMRVAFPHFSRIQNDRQEVWRVLHRYVTYLMLVAGLWLAVLLAGGHWLVMWIYTTKWLPAVPALQIYGFVLLADVVSMAATITLNSLGSVNYPARVYVGRSIANIFLTLLLVHFAGFNGVPWALLVSTVAADFWLLEGLEKGMARRTVRSVAWICIPMAISSVAGVLVTHWMMPVMFKAILATGFVVTTYLLVAWLTAPIWIKSSLDSRLPVRFRRAYSPT